jgi:hypothetical protein
MEISDEVHTPTALLLGIGPCTRYVECHVGPRVELNAEEKRNISYHCRELNPDSLAVQPV